MLLAENLLSNVQFHLNTVKLTSIPLMILNRKQNEDLKLSPCSDTTRRKYLIVVGLSFLIIFLLVSQGIAYSEIDSVVYGMFCLFICGAYLFHTTISVSYYAFHLEKCELLNTMLVFEKNQEPRQSNRMAGYKRPKRGRTITE